MTRTKPLSKTAAKAAAKLAAYEATPRSGLIGPKSRPVLVRHYWDNEMDCLVTKRLYFFRPTGKDWHVEGSIGEIEAKENAGQREMFS